MDRLDLNGDRLRYISLHRRCDQSYCNVRLQFDSYKLLLTQCMVVAAAAPLLIAITLLCNVVAVHPYVCRSAVEVSAWGAVLARRCPWSPNRSITSSPAVELMTLASVQQRLNRSDLYANDVMMRPHRWGGRMVGPLCRRLSIIIVSIVSVVVLRVFNRFRVIRENTLKRLLFHLP
jgi:hypothetical protein